MKWRTSSSYARELHEPAMRAHERCMRPYWARQPVSEGVSTLGVLCCDLPRMLARRVGVLLKELQRATPQTANPSGRAGKEPPATVAGGSAYREAIDANNISERKASANATLRARGQGGRFGG